MSHRLQVLVPEELDARVAKAASRRRLSKGAWVRRVLESALKEEGGGHDAVGRLAALGAPTADIGKMLDEIDTGRRRRSGH
jgi:hypothetical protein